MTPWPPPWRTIFAVVQRENVFGVQCHPERSAKSGALLLKNFLSIE
jgi:imidazoleglycerol phosphate synthase glutamine amidotransferase subunit HisH